MCMRLVYLLADMEVMEMVSVPVAQQNIDEQFDDDDLFSKKFCVLLCMAQNAPECTSEHQNLLGKHVYRCVSSVFRPF